MKIACVDKSAEDRLALQRKLELAFAQCRKAIGHLATAQFIPTTIDELSINRCCDIIVFGSSLALEDAYHNSKALRTALPNCPIVVFLSTAYYSLRTLKRFEPYVDEIFCDDEQAVRIVHKISSLVQTNKEQARGRLLVLQGVKGGVGTTSIVSALAHAAHAIDSSVIVFDLSSSAALMHYMSAPKWQSPDYTTLLSENIYPDRQAVERLIIKAPNGIEMLLPPSGGTETRELLLRNPERFEISLAIIDILRSMYDVVIVDCANAEGVFPYALFAQAHARVLVTSNDPASVHLLNAKLSEVMQTPGDGSTQVLLNMLVERGLTKDDILDFLMLNDYFDEAMAALDCLPQDSRANNWIGTGNSFYTESSSSTQLLLEQMLRTLLLSETDLETRQKLTGSMFGSTKRLTQLFRKKSPKLLGIELHRQSNEEQQPTALRPERSTQVDAPLAKAEATESVAAFSAPTLVTTTHQNLDHYEKTKLFASK